MKCYRFRYISEFIGKRDTPVIEEEVYFLSYDEAALYKVLRYGDEVEDMLFNKQGEQIERFYPIDEIMINDKMQFN